MSLIRGSPDHTVLAEQSFAHYKDVTVARLGGVVPLLPVWEDVVNANIRGVFGYLWMHGTDSRLQVRVTIDGNVVFSWSIWELHDRGFSGIGYLGKKFGCAAYNTEAMDQNLSMWYDEEWTLYVHKNLLIEMTLGGGMPGGSAGRMEVHYKELT